MKENFGYLICAYLLVGGLVTAYSVSLILRSRHVARELERLAAELRRRRAGEGASDAGPPPPGS